MSQSAMQYLETGNKKRMIGKKLDKIAQQN